MLFSLKHIAAFALLVFYPALSLATETKAPITNDNSLNAILKEIQSLEGRSDPKCYATASRLEDFMYGTPLDNSARFYKNDWQKQFIKILWQAAAKLQNEQNRHSFVALLQLSLEDFVNVSTMNNGDWKLQFKTDPITEVSILQRDLRHYGSVAYSLRALLAVQQDNLFSTQPLPNLSEDAIDYLKQTMDLLTLALIKTADQRVRMDNRYEISSKDLQHSQQQLGLIFAEIHPIISGSDPYEGYDYTKNADLLRKIIKQKMASYQQYNDISQQLFVRNLQVYFARLSWPLNQDEARKLKNTFINITTDFALNLYNGSMALAVKDHQNVIKEANVSAFANQLIPHRINDYEDAIFYPKLEREQQVALEAYDMDSFRDSGLHWRYLEFALDAKKQAQQTLMDVDPFAAELLSENIAQFAVLLLRTAGVLGIKANEERLNAHHIEAAYNDIRHLVKLNNGIIPREKKPQRLASSDLEILEKKYFSDVTQSSGIDLMHRSSDWLNRLLRSYLRKDSKTGVITIPPAFGGSGVAAEDINNDGYIDILLLSGLGNQLYLNDGQGHFKDITRVAGLDWVRPEDKHPGEPRQPLITDLNNDGWQDIVITYVNDDARVYKNMGNGRFKDLTASAQLGGKNSVAGPATVFDYDNDGLLDIYISYFGDYLHGVLPTLKRQNQNGLANKLFKNMGDFKFKDVTVSAGVGDTGWGQALSHTDLNNDGWQDLIVGNDFGVNVYYINKKDGTFINYANQLGTDKPSYTMNIGITDLNRDHLPDIYISNIVTMNKDEKYILPNEKTRMKFNADKLANMRVVEANDLFLSSINEKGQLRYELSNTVGRGYSSTGWSWDADFFDADLDGDDDLYVLNGMNEFNLYSSKNPYYADPLEQQRKNILMPVSSKESNVFFINHGGQLKNISHQSGLDLLGNSRSAAYLDFDNDGDLDIILNNYHDKARFYSNNANRLKSNWLKIRPLGDTEKGVSRDAIGTRLIVTTEQGHQVWRELRGSTGYLSVHPKAQHFGLGKASKANITVIWPNGITQSIENVPVNQAYVLDQKNNTLSHLLSR